HQIKQQALRESVGLFVLSVSCCAAQVWYPSGTDGNAVGENLRMKRILQDTGRHPFQQPHATAWGFFISFSRYLID
ncbi:TPA: hypothetical protein ACOQ2V_003128, partial [Serratia odorifera]